MKRAGVLFFILAILNAATAQKMSIPDLYTILDLPANKIDTLLKQKEYRLLEKENDSGVSMVYYTNLERSPNGATWVRSVSYREITIKDVTSRIVTYRTYRKKDYQELLEWLLQNNYQTIKRDNYGEYIDVEYSNGTKSIMVKQSKQKLPSGVSIWSYQFEIGK